MIRKLITASALAVLALAAPAVAPATSLVPANLAQLVDLTEKAFVGTVESVEVVETEQGWAEKISVKVSQAVSGAVAAGDTVTWYQARNGKDVRIASMPEYTVGGEHLVLLSGKAPGSIFQAPIGLGQGDFDIVRNEDTGAVVAVKNDFANQYLWVNVDVEKVGTAAKAKRAAAGKTKAPDELEALVTVIQVLDASASAAKEYQVKDPVPVSGPIPRTLKATVTAE